MRIGISLLNFNPGAVGGIETYIRKVIEHAPLLAKGGDEIIFFVHRENSNTVPDTARKVIVDRSQHVINLFRILEACTPLRARSVENLIAHSGIDVMLYTQQSMFPLHNKTPSVLLVADVQYLFSPQYYSWLDLQFRKSVYLRSLKLCTKIISISNITASHLAERCNVNPDKIEVIPLGYDPEKPPQPEKNISMGYPYFYFPAATYPHKGHAQLIHTFAQLKHSGRISQKLVLSGIQTPHWKTLTKVIRSEKMQNEIIHQGYVSYAQVRALYKGAEAIFFPTEFEGYGLPVLEAVTLQKRIICSRLPIFDELGLPRTWQIDYSDPAQLLNALQQEGPTRLLKEPISWQESIRRNIAILRAVGE